MAKKKTRTGGPDKQALVRAQGSVQSDAAALPDGYAPLLAELKTRVRSAQLKAAVSVNRELILLYWHIGSEILGCQNEQGWGAKVVDRLSRDLRAEVPEMGGLSTRNLLRMRAFANAYPDAEIVPQLGAQIPWGHNILLLERVKDPDARQWYVHKTIEHGWSRSILTTQIETKAHQRAGQAITHFDRTLPPEQSDLAREVLNDPYTFDFLTLADDAVERDLERGLVRHIEKFLLETGRRLCVRRPAGAPGRRRRRVRSRSVVLPSPAALLLRHRPEK